MERQLLAGVVTQELGDALAKAPDAVEDIRAEVKYQRQLSQEIDKLTKAKKDSVAETLKLLEKAELATVPFMDPVDGKPLFAYVRRDEILTVDMSDLRESLYEYFKMRLNQEEDDARVHTLDIIGQVIKPEAASNDVFRKLVENGTIPMEVAAASSTLDHKAAYVAFKKPD